MKWNVLFLILDTGTLVLPFYTEQTVLFFLKGRRDSSCSPPTWNRTFSSSNWTQELLCSRILIPSYMEKTFSSPSRTHPAPSCMEKTFSFSRRTLDASWSLPEWKKTLSYARAIQGCILISCLMETTISSTISRTQEIIFFPSYMEKYDERDICPVLPSLLVIQNYGDFRMKLACSPF